MVVKVHENDINFPTRILDKIKAFLGSSSPIIDPKFLSMLTFSIAARVLIKKYSQLEPPTRTEAGERGDY